MYTVYKRRFKEEAKSEIGKAFGDIWSGIKKIGRAISGKDTYEDLMEEKEALTKHIKDILDYEKQLKEQLKDLSDTKKNKAIDAKIKKIETAHKDDRDIDKLREKIASLKGDRSALTSAKEIDEDDSIEGKDAKKAAKADIEKQKKAIDTKISGLKDAIAEATKVYQDQIDELENSKEEGDPDRIAEINDQLDEAKELKAELSNTKMELIKKMKDLKPKKKDKK